MSKLASCRSCGAEILWVKMESGKNMPVDADPVDDGNLLVDWNALLAHVIPKGADYSGLRFKSHFSTCQNAKQHRKPKQTDAEIDAAVDKATAALDPKKSETEPAPELEAFSGNQAENMMLMLGEAVTDDVEAWEQVLGIPGPTRCVRVTWHGDEFQIDIMQVTP